MYSVHSKNAHVLQYVKCYTRHNSDFFEELRSGPQKQARREQPRGPRGPLLSSPGGVAAPGWEGTCCVCEREKCPKRFPSCLLGFRAAARATGPEVYF